MDALPGDWDGTLLMVDHMAGLVSKISQTVFSAMGDLAARAHDMCAARSAAATQPDVCETTSAPRQCNVCHTRGYYTNQL